MTSKNRGLRIADCGLPCLGTNAMRARRLNPHSALRNPQSRGGFTLVEMLVSVALVMLMMLMFASVFREATKSMTQQKGLAENDQKARTLTIELRGDLATRTFKDVRPYAPQRATPPANEPNDSSATNRQGYFYISENEIANMLDDVLQFTIKVSEDELPLSGRARLLGAVSDLNQPEADDGQLRINGAGNLQITADGAGNTNQTASSRWAEVSWFVRNGTLYRRVMLLRERYDNPDDTDESPTASLVDARYRGTGMSPPNPPANPTASFWGDFDIAARYFGGRATVIGKRSNDPSGGSQFLTSDPRNRFGFDYVSGMPREYGDPSTGTGFIGRFTHRETSDLYFGYPAILRDFDGDGNDDNTPLQPTIPLTVTNGQVNDGTTTFDGPRRGEDAMLHNVHAFDVKVWDDGLSKFVDLGHNEVGGFYRANERRNTYFGPRTVPPTGSNENRVYDTWNQTVDLDGDSNLDRPPFEPRSKSSPHATKSVNAWTAGTDYSQGELVVRSGGDRYDNMVFEVQNGGGTSGLVEPNWPNSQDTTVGDNGIVWISRDNRVLPLKAILITIRYYDVSSDQVRQLTIAYSLL